MTMTLVERPTAISDIGVPPRFKFTAQRVSQMMASGILAEGPFELIEGDILHKMGKNEPHVFVTSQAAQWLIGVFGFEFVRTESPLRLDDNNVPEPDIVVLRHNRRHYLTAGTPPAEDVLLLIEVADSTLPYDTGTKARLYAQAGIADYWVIDVVGRQVIVHGNPAEGTYTTVTRLLEDAMLRPLMMLDSTVALQDWLP